MESRRIDWMETIDPDDESILIPTDISYEEMNRWHGFIGSNVIEKAKMIAITEAMKLSEEELDELDELSTNFWTRLWNNPETSKKFLDACARLNISPMVVLLDKNH